MARHAKAGAAFDACEQACPQANPQSAGASIFLNSHALGVQKKAISRFCRHCRAHCFVALVCFAGQTALRTPCAASRQRRPKAVRITGLQAFTAFGQSMKKILILVTAAALAWGFFALGLHST
jgi:hypothetical protein